MRAYYNEHDSFAAEWLRQLIKRGYLPSGDVDTRSIVDVQPEDLRGYTQCHFFAGIGGWAYALKIINATDLPIWTGSCPCQPFSASGEQRGTDDERHLYPEFSRLIAACQPTIVFGEQVASKLGRQWLSAVQDDLEILGYRTAAADLPAASAGAPHKRQRLFWLGHANGKGLSRESLRQLGSGSKSYWKDHDVLACLDAKLRWIEPGTFPLANGVSNRVGRLRGYGNAIVPQVAATFALSALQAIADV